MILSTICVPHRTVQYLHLLSCIPQATPKFPAHWMCLSIRFKQVASEFKFVVIEVLFVGKDGWVTLNGGGQCVARTYEVRFD